MEGSTLSVSLLSEYSARLCPCARLWLVARCFFLDISTKTLEYRIISNTCLQSWSEIVFGSILPILGYCDRSGSYSKSSLDVSSRLQFGGFV